MTPWAAQAMLVLALALAACSPGALDATTLVTPTPSTCAEATTVQIEECRAGELAIVEAELARVVEEVAERVGARADALQRSQETWTLSTEQLCGAHTEGSLAKVNVLSCKLALARERIIDICSWVSPNASLEAMDDPPPSCLKM